VDQCSDHARQLRLGGGLAREYALVLAGLCFCCGWLRACRPSWVIFPRSWVLACADGQCDGGGLAAFGEPFRGQAGVQESVHEAGSLRSAKPPQKHG
jgi:hypothetical protein